MIASASYGRLRIFRIRAGDALSGGVPAAGGFSVTYDLSNYINGRIRGNLHQDVVGALDIFFGNDSAVMDLDFSVPQDLLQPDFQYPFDIIVIQPVCRFTFLNGAGASSLLRAYFTALPI